MDARTFVTYIDCYGEQHYGLVVARSLETDEYLGHISFSFYRDAYYLDYIEVPEDYRRQGIGTLLVRALESHAEETTPGAEIIQSLTTDDGEGFRQSLEPNPIYRRNADAEIRRLERGFLASPNAEIAERLERARRRAGIIPCEECGQIIASGCECDLPGCRFARRFAFYLDGVEYFSTGIARGCESCGTVGIEDLEYEDMAEEPSFSHYPCQVCNSHLGGDRHAAHGFINDELQHFNICEDCLMYHNYGTTPENYRRYR
jgi:GNAT superfamily N-acetyltransferase